MSTSHNVLSALEVNYSTPLFLVAIVNVFIIFIQFVFEDKLAGWGLTLNKVEMEVDENLPNFFSAVKLIDADWIVNENKHLRE